MFVVISLLRGLDSIFLSCLQHFLLVGCIAHDDKYNTMERIVGMVFLNFPFAMRPALSFFADTAMMILLSVYMMLCYDFKG